MPLNSVELERNACCRDLCELCEAVRPIVVIPKGRNAVDVVHSSADGPQRCAAAPIHLRSMLERELAVRTEEERRGLDLALDTPYRAGGRPRARLRRGELEALGRAMQGRPF